MVSFNHIIQIFLHFGLAVKISRREDIADLLQLNQYIDLVIPRGSQELMNRIQQLTQGIPVLGHTEGICHVYVDKDVDPEMALHIGNVLFSNEFYCPKSHVYRRKTFSYIFSQVSSGSFSNLNCVKCSNFLEHYDSSITA